MTRKSLSSLVGLAGVAEDEHQRAKRLGVLFEFPMLLLAIWMVVEWYLISKSSYPHEWADHTSRVIWFFFLIETIVLTLAVKARRRYLRTNWMNLLIIAIGIPLLWDGHPYGGILRTLRVLLLFSVLLEMSATTRVLLRRNHLGLTLFVACLVILMAGILIAGIDPAIDSPWDGIWWAWVTVTTVGYGDLVPASPQGRIFGGFLMLLGLGLFSHITASFSAFLIAREEEEMIEQEQQIVSKLGQIENRLRTLEKSLNTILSRLPKDK